MPEYGNLLRVDQLVGLEVIDDAAQSPRPCTDRSPLVGLRLLARRERLADDALIECIQSVRLNVLIADHRIAPATREDLGGHRWVVELHRRLAFHRWTSAEVDHEDERDRLRCLRRC